MLVRKKISWKRYQMKIQKLGKWLRLMFPTFKKLCIMKATRDNLKLDKDEKNNGTNHGNKRNLVKHNSQGLIFEPAK